MGREEQIIQERLRKLKELRMAGINPYPGKFDKKQNVKACLESKLGKKVKTAGRLMNKRELGKIAFCNLKDGTGNIQIVLQDKETPKKVFYFLKKYIDSGDFIGVEGKIIKTKTGMISILVDKMEIVSKGILPLPEKFHGLQDEEERLRKRYLDILMNPEIKALFEKQEKFWESIRNFLKERGFMEVETPILETSTGGAAATPFVTHHNALDIDVYLRISMGELWQKKLMVAGYDKTFEIGRQFRNEGIDMEHLQDYTQMEFYWSFADYKDGMKLVEEMYKKVAKDVLGILKFETHGYKIDLGKNGKFMIMKIQLRSLLEFKFTRVQKKKLKKSSMN